MKKKVFSLMMTLVLAFMGMLQAQTQTTLSFGFEEGSLPSGWTKEGPGSWVVTSGDYSSSTGTHTGTYNALCSHSSTGVITYLVTDAMDFSGVTEGTINCWFINRSWAGDTDEFGVYYRVNNGSWNELYYTSSAHQSWSEMGEIALTGFAANYQIGFKMKDNYGYGVGLDDITITTTAGGDEPGGDEPDEPGYVYTDGLHVMSADGTIDTVNVGSRPLNAWMAPYVFKMYNDGDEDYTVTVLDFTPNDGIFENLTEVSFELPAGDTTDIAIDVNATAAGAVERQFVAIYQNTREAHIWPIIAEVYTPEVPDVYELAYDFGTIEPGFEYVGIPADITPTELHNDYTLPYPEIPEGVDGVYKMTFDKAVMLSARVSQGENGKVALYTEDFYGEEGPMATNNYTERPFNGGGGSSAGGELTVHDGEITNSYVPVYGFNADNCLKAEMVYSAAELSDMSGKNINSMKFYLQQTASQGNPWTGPFQVFMKEVAGTTISSFEGLSGATIVYEGAIDGTTSEVTLNFTTPYHYNGGNLLVGVYQTTYHSMVGWGSAYFYGETISGASINGYGSSLEGITSPTQRNFLPKTTFAYGNRSFVEDNAAYAELRAKMMAEGMIAVPTREVEAIMNREPVCGPEIDSMNVLAGTYYLVASSTDDDFEVEINIDELPCPEPAVAVYPADNADGIEPASVTLKWQLSPYCTEWRLVFSSTYWPDDEPNNPFTIITDWSDELAEEYTVTNLFNNTNYFWRIDQRTNGGEEEGGCTVTGEVFGFTTHLNIPHQLTATPDEIFVGETVTLNWTAVVDRTYRQYFIYKDGVKIGETTPNQINQNSFVVPATELAYNMQGYVFNVTAVYDEGESDFSNDAIVKVSGYSNTTGINGHAYEQDGETPIADVTVTITGTDEFNNSHTYTATTDENGYYHVQVYVGHYTMAIANKDGYQETVTNHVLPFDVALNGQVDNVDFIMDEVFYAPSHVCAELVNVGEVDELVKVWWDFGGGSGASGELTVFDGTATESHVPIYGFDADYCLKSEMIMPAADLAPMTGSDINSMKWYITSPSTQSGAWDGPFTIFMKEVSGTTLSSYQGMDGATIVYQGAIDAHTTAEPYIEFTTPYRYNGGNLLIGVYKDVYQSLQGWGSATFMGETHTGASIWGYGQTSDGITATQANFLPKTTFVYGNRENREVAMNRSLHHYNIYRTDCYNDGPYNDTNTVLLATAWVPDTAYIDVSWPEAEPGVYKWGVSAVYQGNRVEYPAEPRESDIVWHTDCAPCIDKDMETQVTVNVLLNSADSPEGTVVSFTNLNELEQQAHPQPSVTLDESGFYAFENFRKGDYQVKVEHLGYETIIDEPVSIWEPTDLRYVMIEIHFPIQNIYVSRTGWAMWDEPDMSGTTPSGGNTIIDFETGDFSQYTFDNTISSYPWTVVQEGNDGYCMKSANAGVASSTSAIEASKNFGSDGMVSFDALCQGEGTSTHWDKCQFFIDGVEMMNHGAEVSGWNNYSYPVTAGEHTFKWSYTKDGSVNPTGDCFKVDNISFTIGRESNEERHLEYYKVLCTSIDGVPIYNHNTVHPFCQLSTNEPYNAPLVEGEHYLCKVAVMYSTGMSEWSEPVEWEYEPCDHWGPVDEVTANTNTQGNHIEWVFEHGFNPYDPGTGPTPEGDTEFSMNFDGTNFEDWTTIDANNDGHNWMHSHDYTFESMDNEGHGGSFGFAVSESYVNGGVGAITPDNYLVSPQVSIVNGSTFSFWATDGNDAYGAEHFGVAISTTGNTNAADFTTIAEWTLLSKGGAKDGGQRQLIDGIWYQKTVDLSAYAGQNVYIAIRHFNCSDQWVLCVDDAELTAGAKGGYSFDKGGEFYSQYADEGVMLNFFAEDNVYFRAFFLYTLSNDSRFTVTPENEYGKFIVNPAYEMDNFMGEFEDFYKNAITDFGLMDKVEVTEANGIWKSNITPAHYLSIMMDVYTIHSRTENDHCINSLPFCTSEVIEFPAAHDGGATADENAEFGCVLSQPYPSWYHMRIETAGQFVIHMEAHDPDNPGSNRDIDYCLWGPFTDPYAPCANDLTCEKIIDCSYSTASVEDAYLGYPLSEHDHGGSSLADGSCITYHVPEVGEYYILMITNYSQQQCNISFTKTEGVGETDCDIVVPTVDILGFLITKDGEYLAFADANVRDYTDVDEFGEHEYCVRPIYPGEMVLPDHNYGWSMGCPVCAEPNGEVSCEAGAAIYAEALNETDQVKIWWGEQEPEPQPSEGDAFTFGFENGFEGWTTIDNDGDGLNWVNSANSVDASGYDYTGYAHGGNYFVYSQSFIDYDGPYNADNYLVTPQKYAIVNGSTLTFWADNANDSYPDHIEVCVATADNPVASDFTMVWSHTGAKSGANAEVRHEGNRVDNWRQHTVDLSAYAGQNVWIAFHHQDNDMYEIWIDDVELTAGAKNRDGIVNYNVYRSADNDNYELIAEVPAVEGQTYYEYIDTPAAGTYYYQVRADYGDCESEPAVSGVNPDVNYVTAEVTGINEIDGVVLYPNPTNSNVTIEAASMRHITVMSVLGQVVYDAEVDNDQVILNMSQYNAGVYVIRVATANGISTHRVTVVR
ncbi:MAG: choice-of-anchor J domain-containing protein [Bacteroidales bacterium]|nr:choice-of-anchor J domain-containing protein [Bacteroidales bacterium]